MKKPTWIHLNSVLIPGLFLLTTGCDNDRQQKTATRKVDNTFAFPESNPAYQQKNPKSDSASIPDRSLSPQEYIALGMPSCDRPWLAPDIVVATEKLQAIYKQSPEKLPRSGSEKSGAMFARIVSNENFDFFQSRALPLSVRMEQAMVYFQSLNSFLKLYFAAYTSGKSTTRELVELMGAQLRFIQVALVVLNEFIPTITKEDPEYATRMAAMERVRQSFARILSSCLLTLTETQYYDVSSRTKLLGYCRETFPNIIREITKLSQQEILRRLDELVDDPKLNDTRTEMISLRDSVRAALKSKE